MKVYFLFITTLLITLIGCPSTPKLVKPNETNNNNKEVVTQPKSDRQISYENDMAFPISDDPHLLSLHSHQMVRQLLKPISDYRRVTGVYPSSISDFFNSGFLLLWPRNVMNGLPVKILAGRDVRAEPDDYGSIKWEKYDDYHAQLISSNIDGKIYHDSGEITWFVEAKDLHFYFVDDYIALPRDELEEYLRHTSSYDLEGATTIVGGINTINMVADSESRMIYAMCGQLSDFIFSTTLNFYSRNKALPSNIIDCLTFQQELGQTPFIIKENLYKFAKMLKDANAQFKVGYDYPKTVSYSLLIVGGETLISHCYKYDAVDAGMDDSPGIHVGCFMEELDMSSPMITDENLSTLEIPDEFFILIKDIPIE